MVRYPSVEEVTFEVRPFGEGCTWINDSEKVTERSAAAAAEAFFVKKYSGSSVTAQRILVASPAGTVRAFDVTRPLAPCTVVEVA